MIVGRAREVDHSLPIGIGLGVSDGSQAAEIGAYADLVIVGSALLKCLDSDGRDLEGDLRRLRLLVDDLASGVERARV